MQTRLVAQVPYSGNQPVVLPTWLESTIVTPYEGVSSLDIHYPRFGVNAPLLDGIAEVTFQYHNGAAWVEPRNARFLSMKTSYDKLEQIPTAKYQFVGYGWLLSTATCKIPAGRPLDADGKQNFLSKNAGNIISTLINDAKARGFLSGVSIDFNGTTDSSGAAWTKIITIAIESTLSIDTVLQNLSEQGVCDYAWQGRTLQIFNPDTTLKPDLTSTVRLKTVFGVNSVPVESTLEDLATDVRVTGDEGKEWNFVNPTAPTALGKIEKVVAQGGVTDPTTAALFADPVMQVGGAARESYTHEFRGPQALMPYRDFGVGALVKVQRGNTYSDLRVQSISLTMSANPISGHLVLGDRLDDVLSRLAKRTKGITGGASTGGTGVRPAPIGTDKRKPKAPAGMIGSATTYIDSNGSQKGYIELDWEDISTAVDGSSMNISGYEVNIRDLTDPYGWTIGTSESSIRIQDLPIKNNFGNLLTYRVRVKSIGENGIKSDLGNALEFAMVIDTTPPPVPSNGSVAAIRGVFHVTWDGKGTGNVTMPVDFSHVILEASTASTGQPWAQVATARGAGIMTYAPTGYGTWYFRMKAVDRQQNVSAPSTVISATSTPLVQEPDIADGITASASQRSRIVHKPTTPTVPTGGWSVGDIWYQWNGTEFAAGNTVIASYRWNGTAWQEWELNEAYLPLVNIGAGTYGSLDGGRLTALSVDTPQLKANSVEFDKIAGGAVRAQHMAVGSVPDKALQFGVDELIPNPKWLQTDYDALYGPVAVSTSTALTPLAGALGWGYSTEPPLQYGQPKVLTLNLIATVNAEEFMPIGPAINASGGDKFYMQIESYSTANPNVIISYQLHAFNTSGVYISAGTTKIDVPTTNTQDAWQTASAVVTVPAGTAYIVPVVRKASRAVAGVGKVHVSNLSLRRVMAGGSSGGQSMELSPAGITLFDADGAEVVSMTSTPPNYVSIRNPVGDTIANMGRVEIGEDTGVYEGVIAADNLNIENDPEFMGDRLIGSLSSWESPSMFERTGLLDEAARGCIAYGSRLIQGRQITNGEFEQMELHFDYFAGRSYMINIEPLSVYLDNNSYGYIRVRREYSDQTSARPTYNSGILRQFTWRNLTGAQSMFQMGGSFLLDASATATCRLLITIGAEPGTIQAWNSNPHGTLRVQVYDMGMRVEESGMNREGANYYDTTPPTNPTPPAVIKNYTKTYSATGYRTYFTGGGFYNYNTSKMYQGNSPAVGGLQSIATFPSMTSDLSGATITSVRAYFYFEHWYYNSGGTAKIGMHGQTSLPATKPTITQAVTSSSWPKPGGRWVNIPSSFWAGIKSGTYRGLTLGDTSPSTTEYGYARGSATKLEIKYKK